MQTLLDIVHGTTCISTIRFFLSEMDTKCDFRKFLLPCQKCRYPHPKYSAGTADCNRSRDSCDITGSDNEKRD